MKYRKKPVVIEAERIPQVWEIEARLDFEAWLYGNGIVESSKDLYDGGSRVRWKDSGITILTLEGEMYGEADDYLIIGVRGEIYPCDKEIFRETYEEVEQ
jgi:hypothetical protein